jgi:glyoxylase-like metal-dependent hydrolase (beta-lactamase superfamily II)
MQRCKPNSFSPVRSATQPLLLVTALLLSISTAITAFAADIQPGQPLPAWTPGTLDIHQISTGRGNSALFVFPDGTTMLLDAGAAGDGMKIADTEQRPNATRTSGDWIARYIERTLAPAAARLDYAAITHYHADHFGQVTPSSPASKNGNYKLTGITEVGDRIAIGLMIDRGDFQAPATDPTLINYRAFVDAQKTHGMKAEAIRVGRADQIVLVHDRERYPTFEVRNVAGSGDVWTGHENEVARIFPPLDSLAAEDRPSENMCSIGLRIRYGRFDYFTGGDMPGVPDAGSPDWQSVETAVAKAIGPTDVHVVNHHGSIDPESTQFLSTLRSTVMILPSWSPTHPSQDALKRMMTARLYPGPHDIFATLIREPTKISIGSRAGQVKADHGHIVVRVAPGGDSYQVIVLDDLSEEPRVLSVHGPYERL